MKDVHAHIGGVDPYEKQVGRGPGPGTAEEFNEFLEEFSIEDGLAYPMAFSAFFDGTTMEQEIMDTTGEMPAPYYDENRNLLESVEGYDRLYPVLFFSTGHHDNIDDVRHLAENHPEVKALKVHPKSSHSDLGEMHDSEILDISREYELPIISHLESDNWPDRGEGFDLRGYSSPERLLSLAEANPDINFQGAHLANFSESFLEAVSELDNVYVDCSPPVMLTQLKGHMASDALDLDYDNPARALDQLVEKYPNTILYGSDYPYMRKEGKPLSVEGEILFDIRDETYDRMDSNAEELYF